MANDAIKIITNDNNASEAAELMQYIRTLRTAYELGLRIRAKMQRHFDDSGGENNIDWSLVQQRWGVPSNVVDQEGTDVGPTANGAIIFTLVNGSVGAMEGTFQNGQCKEITERVV
jgi:hypothetical protein